MGIISIDDDSRKVRVIPREDLAREFDDDLRRVTLSQLTLVKRRFPDDWRKMVLELVEAKAA